MEDRTDNIRREIGVLSTEEKVDIAKQLVRSLDPIDRDVFVSEFERSPEAVEANRQFYLRMVLVGMGSILIALCIFALILTMREAPEHIDKVGGVITTVVSGA